MIRPTTRQRPYQQDSVPANTVSRRTVLSYRWGYTARIDLWSVIESTLDFLCEDEFLKY